MKRTITYVSKTGNVQFSLPACNLYKVYSFSDSSSVVIGRVKLSLSLIERSNPLWICHDCERTSDTKPINLWVLFLVLNYLPFARFVGNPATLEASVSHSRLHNHAETRPKHSIAKMEIRSHKGQSFVIANCSRIKRWIVRTSTVLNVPPVRNRVWGSPMYCFRTLG